MHGRSIIGSFACRGVTVERGLGGAMSGVRRRCPSARLAWLAGATPATHGARARYAGQCQQGATDQRCKGKRDPGRPGAPARDGRPRCKAGLHQMFGGEVAGQQFHFADDLAQAIILGFIAL